MNGDDAWMPFPIGMSWQYNNVTDKSAIQFGPHDKTALCAFRATTDSGRRLSGITRREILTTVTKNGFENIQLDGNSYFSALPSYKFVFSPEGNGIDCHRHYEALLAGCIPIMEDNPLVRAKYEGCPILYTTDYSEITPEYLNAKYAEMLNMEYDFSRLFLWFYTAEQRTQIRQYGNYWIRHCNHQSGPDYYRDYHCIAEYFSVIRGTPIVWITIINKGYIEFTKNFLASIDKHRCPFTLVIYCLDKESLAAFSDYQNAVTFDASAFITGQGNHETGLTSWGMSSYKKIVFTKLDAMQYTLEQCKGYGFQGVGYIDTDIIVLKNPTPIILEAMAANPTVDIFHQCDENVNNEQVCTNPALCPNMCSGAIVFKVTTVPTHIFAYSSADRHWHMGDQDYLVKRIDAAGLRRYSISKYIFLNGIFPNLTNDEPLVLPESAVLIHFNCMVGLQKKHNMQRKGMWY